METSECKCIHGNCLDVLRQYVTQEVALIFLDPPDNLGLVYDEYVDKMTPWLYYAWLETVILASLLAGDIVWFSYYWKHDVEIKYLLREIKRTRHPTLNIKPILWRFTFGQYCSSDCSSGYRPMVRLTKPHSTLHPDAIRVPSARMDLGDSRAAGPRVPDDVWEFPRVTGNSRERRSWHPTQHPEALMERIINFTTRPGDLVIDAFAGTGTTLRVCKRLRRSCIAIDSSINYITRVAEENQCPLEQ